MLRHMAIDPIQLTKQLVDIESTTYCEGLAGAFLHEYLTAQRYAVDRMPVPQPDHSITPGAGTGERFNVYAALPGVTPDVVLSTHMDTVPPFFGASEDDEFVYGRGSCDAKGIIAAQVAAADRLRESGVKVGLLFVVGEERDSAGAMVANMSPKGSKFLINGEPTDNRIALASKGALRVELRAKGRMAHSAYPELGESAIDKLVAALHDVLAMPLPSEPEIGPSTLNIGLISGGYAPNVIADKAEAHILIRLVGPSDETKKSIRATVGDRADVAFSLDLPFVRMRKVGNRPTMIAKFATDIPALTAWGEPFLLGPAPSTSRIRRTKRSLRKSYWTQWNCTWSLPPALPRTRSLYDEAPSQAPDSGLRPRHHSDRRRYFRLPSHPHREHSCYILQRHHCSRHAGQL